jgi:glutathione peroxidase
MRRVAHVLTIILLLCAAVALPAPATAGSAGSFSFPAIEGGTIDLSDHAGRPVLVVNTASQCGYAPQFDDLQALHEQYGPRGLLVLAVPSDDFRQELDSNEAVRAFCAVNFDLTLPMAEVTRVRGAAAHPFYAWLAREHGFRPRWNFNKVLIDGAGRPVATWGAAVRPTSPEVTARIEALLR